MTHFKYSETQLQDKPLTELRRISRQIGASWEIGNDQRVKTNWVKAILNHQSKIQERLPEQATSKFFSEITTEAQVGDYFRIPFQPIVQVVECDRTSPIKVTFTVATVTGETESWEVKLKEPQPQPQPQHTPVDPLDKPFDEVTPEEWERLKTFGERGSDFGVSAVRPYRSKSEAFRAIVGHCPGGLFPSEKIITPNYPLLTHCADCSGHGCGNCDYTGMKATWNGTQEYWFRYYDTLEDDDRGSGRRCYRVFLQGRQLGVVMQVRNPAEKWDNTPNTYYYVVGDGKKYFSVEEAAVSLTQLIQSPVS